MASIESLPADQRAVLQLVLQRGRSYDEIARLLSIDRSAVRQRATSALNALGPQTGLADERRQLITDYLLGQLDSDAATTAQSELAAAPGERAWARVVASELTPLVSGPLPEIPPAAAESPPASAQAAPAQPTPAPEAAPAPAEPVPAPAESVPVAAEPVPAPAPPAPPPVPAVAPPPAGGPDADAKPDSEPKPAKPKRESILLRRARRNKAASGAAPATGAAPASEAPSSPAPASTPKPAKPKRESILLRRARRNATDAASGAGAAAAGGASGGSPPEPGGGADEDSGGSSLLGGMVLIVLTVVIVAAVVVILLSSGGSSPTHAASASSTTSTATAPAASATTTASSSSAAKVIAQINLTPPTATSKAAGIAEVLKEGANNGIAIVAQNVPPNTTKPPNAYAVWLYNSGTDAHILGFVNPGVAANGRLSTAGGLPTNASHYKQLIVTLETKASPTTPGAIVLQGKLTLGP